MQVKNNLFLRLSWPILLLLLLPASLLAQSSKELDLRLANGKQLLDQGKYELALVELTPVIKTASSYKQAPQALYLYSLAAWRTQKVQEAQERINQLLQQYPNWPQRAEAQYLDALIAMERKDYVRALTSLASLNDPALEADKAALKQTYLTRIQDKALLLSLVQQFPQDRELAVVYADKLMGGWYTDKDKAVLEEIIRRFNLDRKKYAARPVSQKKGEYKVALLLPFPLKETDEAKIRKSQFITDLYSGIVMAKDSLARHNINLSLFCYEAPADTNKVKAVLALPEMASMDLIIGPVYKSASRIISRFANEHQIIAINPLSDDAALVKTSPYLYLFRASITTQARKMAAFAMETFPVKTAAVVYSNSEDYILFAKAYKAEYEKRGGKVRLMKAVSPSSSGSGIYSGLDFSTLGHLVVASNNSGLAYNTISTLERQPAKVPVLTYASWLEMTEMSLKQLDDQEVYFMHPWYVDTSLESVKAFRKDYVSRFQVPPSEYAYAGFDLMYYFGNILARHGARFQNGLASEGAISGAFLQGLFYGGEHDNQYVPVLKLDNLQLNVVNPVFK